MREKGDEPRSEMLIELFEDVCLRGVLFAVGECVVWMKKQRDGRVNR